MATKKKVVEQLQKEQVMGDEEFTSAEGIPTSIESPAPSGHAADVCCIESAKHAINIKHRPEGGENWTQEIRASYCMVCGKKL